jgi:hypothetical protein
MSARSSACALGTHELMTTLPAISWTVYGPTDFAAASRVNQQRSADIGSLTEGSGRRFSVSFMDCFQSFSLIWQTALEREHGRQLLTH